MGEEHRGNAWILAIVGSTVSWALADLILDVTISEEKTEAIMGEDGNGGGGGGGGGEKNLSDNNNPEDLVDHSNNETKPLTTSSSLSQKTHFLTERKKMMIATTSSTSTNNASNNNNAGGTTSYSQIGTISTNITDGDDDKKKTLSTKHLNGDQDTAVAGVVTLFIVYAMCIDRWISHRRWARVFEEKYLKDADNWEISVLPQSSSGVGGVWSPFHDFEWWLTALGGLFLFWHYQTLYWAYDTAPSTVINPLLQVSSTWVLLGTAIPAAITGSTFIKPFDLFCYGIIVIGGLLPSLEGDFKAMLKFSFWKQKHVKYAVFSEITLGLYDLLLSFVIKRGKLASDSNEHFKAGGPNVLENEFFFLAWCWFVVSFAFSYGFHPRLQEEYFALRHVSIKVLFLAGVGQVIMFIGYYSSQFAYSWFYQASVVHAAEASMAQGFNLVAAYIGKTIFDVGRESAVKGMKFKVFSVIIVSIGLFLIAFSDMNDGGSSSGGGHGRRRLL